MCCNNLFLFCKNWKLWIRPFVVIVYVLLILTFIPALIVHELQDGIKKKELGPLVGGGFVLLALPISFWQIIQHVVHYTQPHLQKHIIRILWMVPIYAVNAWLGLIYTKQSIYMNSIRECYEAYVIYNFMKYLLNYLHNEYDLEASLETKPQVKHFFPFCFLAPWEMGREFVQMCKHGILQYTVFRPVTTIISVICELCGVYGEGNFSGTVAFPYIVAINNLSQFVAMYCLVLFYRANRVELRPMKPIGKFLCIKAVVFFSFFQGVLIQMGVYFDIISVAFNTDSDSGVREIATRLQDFLLCIEMFFAAIAHHYSFSYKAFINELAPQQPCIRSFLAMWDVSDVGGDIQEYLEVVGSSLSRRIRGRSMYSLAKGSEISENDRLVGSAPERIGVPYQSSQRYNSSDGTDTYKDGSGGMTSESGTYGSLRNSSANTNDLTPTVQISGSFKYENDHKMV